MTPALQSNASGSFATLPAQPSNLPPTPHPPHRIQNSLPTGSPFDPIISQTRT